MRLATKCRVERKNVEASMWYSVALNVLEEPYNAMPRRIAEFIKVKGDASIY